MLSLLVMEFSTVYSCHTVSLDVVSAEMRVEMVAVIDLLVVLLLVIVNGCLLLTNRRRWLNADSVKTSVKTLPKVKISPHMHMYFRKGQHLENTQA